MTSAVAVRGPAFLIVGTPRSGTTLVQRLASELASVRVPPETHFFTEFALSLADRCTFPLAGDELRAELQAYSDRGYLRDVAFDPAAVADALGGRCESVPALFAAVVDELAGDGAPVVGEKTPGHLLWWKPLTDAFPQLKLVVVVRDPRGVVASYEQLGWGGSHVLNAQKWCYDIRQARTAFASLGPSRSLLVRFEDVLSDPIAARGRIAAFLGVEDEVAGVDGPLFPGWEQWKADVLGPINADRATEWKRALTPSIASTVAAVCHRQMGHLGYDAPGLPAALARQATIGPVVQVKRLRRELTRRRFQARLTRIGRTWQPFADA